MSVVIARQARNRKPPGSRVVFACFEGITSCTDSFCTLSAGPCADRGRALAGKNGKTQGAAQRLPVKGELKAAFFPRDDRPQGLSAMHCKRKMCWGETSDAATRGNAGKAWACMLLRKAYLRSALGNRPPSSAVWHRLWWLGREGSGFARGWRRKSRLELCSTGFGDKKRGLLAKSPFFLVELGRIELPTS